MTTRSTLGVIAAIFGLFGLVCGVLEWFLQIFILPDLDWPDSLGSISNLCWLGHIGFYGLGVILAGIAVSLPIKAEKSAENKAQVQIPPLPITPPTIASEPPITAKPIPVEETRSAEDLWQSADAPFPAPPSIDHPSSGPSLWQSDQAPFPKVDIPEEDSDANNQEADDNEAARRGN
ncbi:hypothetical protein [Cerasicoccus arenae]|uniref:Uncharacterized protein n=1 Tax=Cerasicoccus arenae TaxID=424488 RepID=A0A8J3DFE7_9BACT|nr:hypothetical protein [Cerasicoccus arenae]MBK1859739.1 hypothetical protein [Cerasicoccus arenae]GHB93522.1 hypothetical protein GCM10007047_06250 [Cerasicoccus arenae]